LREARWIRTLCDEHNASGQDVEDHGCVITRETIGMYASGSRAIMSRMGSGCDPN